MVNGQIHPSGVGLGVFREQAYSGDVGGDDGVGNKTLRSLVGPEIGGGVPGQLRVGQEISRLAQGPQPRAQRGGAAHCVPVRAHVGQDQYMVDGLQKLCGLRDSQHPHSSVSCWALSRASSCCSTWRSTSRMWAPCWMESSATNCSSGV